jgi:uncharacterized heparinase superfamily protein
MGIAGTLKGLVRIAYIRMAVDLGGPMRALNLRAAKTPAFRNIRPSLSTGDVEQGLEILDGQFSLGSQSVDVGAHGDPWSNAAPSEPFAFKLHSFSWLDDLTAVTQSRKLVKSNPDISLLAANRACHLVDRWIETYGKWNAYAWDNDILANRLFAWLSNWGALLHYDFERPQGIERRVQTVRQLKRLRQTFKRTPAGLPRLKAAACLVLGGVHATGNHRGLLEKGLDLLDEEIEQQILMDGGHISRSPEQTMRALHILLITENALKAADLQGSKEIRRAIDRISPMMGFFSADKFGLFNFNGGGEGNSTLLKKLGAKPRAKQFRFAPHSKYQRLSRNGTIVMLDVGGSPPRPFDCEAHLAPLAMEVATAEGRLIVNCGWDKRQPSDWRGPMRATAAHSTLILNGQDAGKILTSGLRAKIFGGAISKNAGPVQCSRKEQDVGTWVEATHEAYQIPFGLSHRRRLYMNEQGSDIRGEDSLFVPLGETPLNRDEIPFDIRFHLHPDVRVTLAQDQKSALLIQKGGAGWRFRTDGGPLSVEKSVYLGTGARPRRCEQLVIRGRAYGDSDGQTKSNRVRWSLIRMGESA